MHQTYYLGFGLASETTISGNDIELTFNQWVALRDRLNELIAIETVNEIRKNGLTVTAKITI